MWTKQNKIVALFAVVLVLSGLAIALMYVSDALPNQIKGEAGRAVLECKNTGCSCHGTDGEHYGGDTYCGDCEECQQKNGEAYHPQPGS